MSCFVLLCVVATALLPLRFENLDTDDVRDVYKHWEIIHDVHFIII